MTCGRSLAVALTTLILLGGCNRGPAAPAAPAAPPADAWATVDGRNIMAADVEKAFQRTRDLSATLSSEATQAAKMSLLEDLITRDLLLAKAQALMIDATQAEVDKAVADAQANVTGEQFQQELSKRGLTTEDLRESLRRDLIVQKVLENQVTAKVAVTDVEITDFFNANRAQFSLAETTYRLAQIVVTPVREPQQVNASGDDAASPQQVQQKVAALMQRLQMGESFAQLAAQYSEDAESAARGGDLGGIPESAVRQANPALRNAVLQLTPGNARIVNQDGAAVIVLLVAKEPAGQRDLSTPGVKEQIESALKTAREQLLRSAYLTMLRTDARITNHAAKRVVDAGGRI